MVSENSELPSAQPWQKSRIVPVGILVIAATLLTRHLLTEYAKEPVMRRQFRVAEPVGRYTARELTELWNDNPQAAGRMLNRKLIEVTGNVIQFRWHDEIEPQQGDIVLGDRKDQLDIVINSLVGDLEPWQQVTPGQTVTLSAQLHQFDATSFILDNCRVIAVTGAPSPRLTADEFYFRLQAGEWSPQGSIASQIFSIGPHLIVTGTIQQVGKSASQEVEVTLSTSNALPLQCVFASNAPRVASDAEIGQQITLIGERRGAWPLNPALQGCFRIDSPSETQSTGFK